MHAVKKRGGSALLLTRCYMKRKTEYKILNQKWQKKEKVCKQFTSQFGVGLTTDSKRTQYGQNNVSFVIGVSKENSIMGTELETLRFIWK